ncbi:DUF47 family protein [Candidatus Bathyarchaeota archaeon]|nr:DUF47 family protein [Candidatus Bathyarchaeota archaeon]
MSELIKWFEKRKEAKALAIIKKHLALTMEIVADLERTFDAAINQDMDEMRKYVERIAQKEKEADMLRRRVMDELSRGELTPSAREDIMHLVKRVDMVADWSRESTRILAAIPIEHIPEAIKEVLLEMVNGVKKCAISLKECVDKMMINPEEALKAADIVEREEEEVDDIHEKARILLGKEDPPTAGIAVLISQLLEAIEMIADSCEDACDQVRIVIVRI